jgi:hypothetical protein
MQAINTKSFGPGNVRGSRVKASAQAGSIFVGWDHALNYERNHAAAAQALATKFGWHGGGMVWVQAADARDTFSVTPKEQTQ